MKTSDFNYQLPEELIAQTPLERRDGSRLHDSGPEHRRLGASPFLRAAGLPEPRRLPDSERLPGAARPSAGSASAGRRRL